MKRLEFMKKNGYHDPNGIVRDFYLPKRGNEIMFSHQSTTIARGGLENPINGINFHLEYPFLTPFKIGSPQHFRKEAFCFMHYLMDAYKIVVCVNLRDLLESFIDWMRYPYFCKHLIKFWDLFLPMHVWYQNVEYIINNHCKEGDKFSLLQLGHDFTSDYEKGLIHVTIEWLNLSKEDPFEIIRSKEKQCMYFRSKMLAEYGYDEMQHLDLITREPFVYDDYPSWYVKRLIEAKQRFEKKSNPDSGDCWDDYQPSNPYEEDPWYGYHEFVFD